MPVKADGTAARLGLPPNPARHPDPAVRRAYWAEIKRIDRAEKRRRALEGKARCPQRFGPGTCGTLLIYTRDRLGRVHAHCPACDRMRAGRCALCPRRVDGPIGVAKYCAHCRLPAKTAQKIARETADRDRVLALKRKNVRQRRARERKALADPATPADVRLALLAKREHERELARTRRVRFLARAGKSGRAQPHRAG